MIGVGMLGSGFIGDCYADALRDVRNAELVACFSRDPTRSAAFAAKWGPDLVSHPTMEALCADRRVDVVVIALPNEAHLEATRVVARHGKAVICTKPLARTETEAAAMLRTVRDAGVWHGYAESAVFSPKIATAYEMLTAGGIGKLLTMRAREGHSGPHAPHFWKAETAGGGALLDMGCHTIETARYFFGKDNPIVEVLAWGATLKHADKTTGEDTCIALLKFAGGEFASLESSWIEKGGMQLRHELVGSEGRIVTDSSVGPIWGFVSQPVGYTVEKADSDIGWVYPVPEETRAYGFSQQMRHFIDSFVAGQAPRETFEDGLVVNRVIDACYRSMKTKQWEKVAES
ncbi:MAG: Gfo/Idh/MocA family oxidoreductase [Devosia sp.]|nr:Gfo/Idh/MocA family oxidoreductase [Devosia sp.]